VHRSTPKLRRSVAKKNPRFACTRDTCVRGTNEENVRVRERGGEGEKGGGDRGGGENRGEQERRNERGSRSAGGRPLLKKLPLSSVRRS